MMATFYTFKDKVNEPEPLVKNPGEVDGQMFDIGDCENSTLVIMDQCEQVQIDVLKNCRVFVGACTSSIFIRNCENCFFYTCCRQLRLREVTNSTFYIYSMAEVHIEYSNGLKFAPFNGGYPEHLKHLQAASLDPKHNLWYDIFDHNDPAKTHANWSLLPEAEYEEPWFPQGTPCEPAVPRTKAGSVVRVTEESSSMQSFSVQQMIADAEQLKSAAVAAPPVAPILEAATAAITLPPAPPVEIAAPPAPPLPEAQTAASPTPTNADTITMESATTVGELAAALEAVKSSDN